MYPDNEASLSVDHHQMCLSQTDIDEVSLCVVLHILEVLLSILKAYLKRYAAQKCALKGHWTSLTSSPTFSKKV